MRDKLTITENNSYTHNRRLSTVILGAPNNSSPLIQRHVYQGADRGQTLGLNTSQEGIGAVSGTNTITTNRTNGNVTANIIKLYYHTDRLGTVDFLTNNNIRTTNQNSQGNQGGGGNSQGNQGNNQTQTSAVVAFASYDTWGLPFASCPDNQDGNSQGGGGQGGQGNQGGNSQGTSSNNAAIRIGQRSISHLTISYTSFMYDTILNLHFAQARMYNPTIRRFISPDPIQGWITNPQSLNLYIFVLNNPLRWVDPLGLTPQQPNSNVGLRDFAEAAGATVGWNEGTRHASVTHNGRTEYFYIGDHTVIDGRIQIDPRELGWLSGSSGPSVGGGNTNSGSGSGAGSGTGSGSGSGGSSGAGSGSGGGAGSGSNTNAGFGNMNDWLGGLTQCDRDFIAEYTAGMSESEAFRAKVDMRAVHTQIGSLNAFRQLDVQTYARNRVTGDNHTMPTVLGGGGSIVFGAFRLSSNATANDRQEFFRAIAYLSGSPTFVEMFGFINDSGHTIELRFNDDHRLLAARYIETGQMAVYWDATSGLVVGERARTGMYVQSAALGLAHEMGHIVQFIDGTWDHFNERAETAADRRYKVEADNMKRFEIPIAIELGEPVRLHYTHHKNPVRTGTSTAWGLAAATIPEVVAHRLRIANANWGSFRNHNEWEWDGEIPSLH